MKGIETNTAIKYTNDDKQEILQVPNLKSIAIDNYGNEKPLDIETMDKKGDTLEVDKDASRKYGVKAKCKIK